MWSMIWKLIIFLSFLFYLVNAQVHQPHSVRIEYLSVSRHPDLVIDTHTPHFSWQHGFVDQEFESLPRSIVQSAYQLRIQSVDTLLRKNAEVLDWDSGKIQSSDSRQVSYSGPHFQSDTTYQWFLKYWLNDGSESEWSSGIFRTALFFPKVEMNGTWIGHNMINMNELRKEFVTPTTLSRATIFISGIGYYELYLNGTQIDPSRRMDPGWTLYEEDVLYVSYDVTSSLIANSPAAVGVRLGDGWYSQQQNQPAFGNEHASYGPSRLLFQLNMQTNDGNVISVVSDTTWLGREGMVSESTPYMGEIYSGLKEREGWSQPNFIDPYSLWINPIVLPSPLTNPNTTQYGLRLQTMEPIRAGDAALHIATSGKKSGVAGSQPGVDGGNLLQGGVLHPVAIQQPNVGTYVFDMGQTFSGTCTVTFVGVPPRITVNFQHAEVLRQPGHNGVQYYLGDPMYIRGATSTDFYTTKGVDGESFTPKFTVHGFRYFSVYGLYTVNQIKDVTCNFVHSSTSLIGNFSTDNPVINQIQHNIQWGTLSNLMSVASDCPSRDERRGYGGDASLSVDTVLFNFDFAPFYLSWLYQWQVSQGPDGSVPIVVPGGAGQGDPNWETVLATVTWQLYVHYGDVSMVQKNYNLVRNWVDYMWGQYNQTGLVNFFGPIGDWVPPPFGQTNIHLISSFPFLNDLYHLINMSTLLNYTDAAQQYDTLYNKLTAEFHSTWYHDSIKGYADGMQAANVLALALPGVVPANLTSTVLNSLITDIKNRNQFTTGIVSIAHLFPILSKSGNHDLALHLIEQTTYPSYGFQFNNPYEVNATTLWEVWDAPINGGGPGMNSRNHHMYASVGSWFYRFIGGIDTNGFAPIIIHPRMAVDHTLLPTVHVEVQSVAGPIVVDYHRESQDVIVMSVTVPTNTQAKLTLEPLMPGSRCTTLTESGDVMVKRSIRTLNNFQADKIPGISEVAENNNNIEMVLQSGVYVFKAQWSSV